MNQASWTGKAAKQALMALSIGGAIAVVASTQAQARVFGKVDSAEPVSVASQNGTEWSPWIDGQVSGPSGEAVAGAIVAYNGQSYRTDASGKFRIASASDGKGNVIIRAPGYRRVFVQPTRDSFQVTLQPQEIKAVYLQAHSVKKSDSRYDKAIDLIQTTELNGLVIDFKDDEGVIHRDLKPKLAMLSRMGVYTIARVTSFKDNRAPVSDPTMAVLDQSGKPWRDRNGVRYLNPLNPRARAYLVNVAVDAVEAGFDEVQFDYVRFPTDGNLKAVKWDRPLDSVTRTAAIASFLKEARAEITARGAFVAADVFGITGHDKNDSGIGQHVETITPFLDYVSPMVYPSGYARGTDGIASPPDQPGAIVLKTLVRYRKRAAPEAVVRPWIQGFRDYNKYSRRSYGAAEIRAQIDASTSAGSEGFMIWNAAGKYTEAGLDIESMLTPGADEGGLR